MRLELFFYLRSEISHSVILITNNKILDGLLIARYRLETSCLGIQFNSIHRKCVTDKYFCHNLTNIFVFQIIISARNEFFLLRCYWELSGFWGVIFRHQRDAVNGKRKHSERAIYTITQVTKQKEGLPGGVCFEKRHLWAKYLFVCACVLSE